MREIKFRGVTHEFSSPSWVYGDLICNSTDEPRIMDDYHDCYELTTWLVDPETVGQFTGLKDAKGKEIYEGDIVKATLKDKSFAKRFNMDETVVGKISFDGAWWLGEWDALWRLPRYYDLTVSGNVYDNPELIKK